MNLEMLNEGDALWHNIIVGKFYNSQADSIWPGQIIGGAPWRFICPMILLITGALEMAFTHPSGRILS